MTAETPNPIAATIHFEHTDIHLPKPWPIALDGNGDVIAGLPPADLGAVLIGFGPQGEQTVTVFRDEAYVDPEKVVGLIPTFGRGTMFSWDMKVSKLVVRD